MAHIDIIVERMLPELCELIEAIMLMAKFEPSEEAAEAVEIIELCRRIAKQRGDLPLVEYLRVLAR